MMNQILFAGWGVSLLIRERVPGPSPGESSRCCAIAYSVGPPARPFWKFKDTSSEEARFGGREVRRSHISRSSMCSHKVPEMSARESSKQCGSQKYIYPLQAILQVRRGRMTNVQMSLLISPRPG